MHNIDKIPHLGTNTHLVSIIQVAKISPLARVYSAHIHAHAMHKLALEDV
jgi:hypothetical protein